MKKGTSHENLIETESNIIKSINQKVYEALDKFGEIIIGRPIKISKGGVSDTNNFIEFNKNGETLKEVFFDEQNKIIQTIQYVYDNENLIEKTSTSIEDSWEKNYKVIQVYDSNGRITEYKNFRSDGSIRSCNKYRYSDEPKPTVVKLYDADGIFYKKIIKKYDSGGSLLTKEHYSSSGHLAEVEQFSYTKGKLIEYCSYFIQNGEKCFNKTKRYDDHGRIIYDSFATRNFNEYEFNEDGFVVKHITSTHTSSFGQYKDECSYIYEKDKNDNWIKRVHFRNEIPFVITIREIEYF